MPFHIHKNKPSGRPSQISLSVFALILFAAALYFGAVSPAPAQASGKSLTLTIAHINDLHAHLTPSDNNGQLCQGLANTDCFGGAPRIKTAVDALRAKDKPLLVLDAGDQFQGTLFFTLFKGDAIALAANAIGFDAMTLGNHEFDNGPAPLIEYLGKLQAPMLAANVKIDDPKLAALIKPYKIFDFKGQKVAVVGIANEDTTRMSSPGQGIAFQRAEDVLPAVIKHLHGQGVTHIIALTHVGLERDKEIAAAVPGLSAIVGGHSHTYLSNTDPLAQGPYPVVVRSPEGRQVPIVQAWAWGRKLGELTLEMGDTVRVVSSESFPLALDAKIAENQALAAELRTYAERFGPYLSTVVGYLQEDLVGSATQCRQNECQLGNLSAQAMLEAAKPYGATMAVLNAGSLRADLPKGDVTLAGLLTTFPFANTVEVVTLPGTAIREMMEHALSLSESSTGRSTGRFLQIAGLRVRFDPAKPAGQRIQSIEAADAYGMFSPLDPQAAYRLALNSYMLGGGDGFTQFSQATDIMDDGVPMDVAVANYLRNHKPLSIPLDGRLTRVTQP